MKEIEKNDQNLNSARHISTTVAEEETDLSAVHGELVALGQTIHEARVNHNAFPAAPTASDQGRAPLIFSPSVDQWRSQKTPRLP
ncbi:MAG: hypothetical protein VKJ05_04945 [Synechococcaceae cyanobacterium]|nr:hypothetical protein [Synechococcaceae cyanobacterium]